MKQIRTAIIGCGGWVRHHVEAIRDDVPEFRVVALCDKDAQRATVFRKAHFPRKRIGVYADHKEMLAGAAPDAVIVSTPHTLHYPHCRDAIRAGAHVLVDKPMVTDSRHARRLVRQAEKADCILQIAIQGTYTDTFAYARKLLADGTMGQLQLVTGIMAQGWLQGTAGKWRQVPKLSGGGQLYDSSSHVLSAMMFLVDSPVEEVFCWADNCGAVVDINAVACIRFENGAMATMTSGGNCPTWKSHLTLQGDGARMEISPHGGDFLVHRRKPDLEITAVPSGWDIPTVSPVRNFADAIVGRAAPRCGGRLGILLADLMDALYASAASNRPVKPARKG